MDGCDLLILVGTDFPYRDFYPNSAKVIQVDIEPTRIGRRHPVDIGLVGQLYAEAPRRGVAHLAADGYIGWPRDRNGSMDGSMKSLQDFRTHPVSHAFSALGDR